MSSFLYYVRSKRETAVAVELERALVASDAVVEFSDLANGSRLYRVSVADLYRMPSDGHSWYMSEALDPEWELYELPEAANLKDMQRGTPWAPLTGDTLSTASGHPAQRIEDELRLVEEQDGSLTLYIGRESVSVERGARAKEKARLVRELASRFFTEGEE